MVALPHMEEHSYQAMADDVAAFLEANWMYEVDVLGHSMGARWPCAWRWIIPTWCDDSSS